MTLDQREMRRLAKLGAQSRLAALGTEEAQLLRAFPELGKPGTRRGRPPKTNGTSATTSTKPRRGYNMSAAQRKAVSERMKKYWAARRKAAK